MRLNVALILEQEKFTWRQIKKMNITQYGEEGKIPDALKHLVPFRLMPQSQVGQWCFILERRCGDKRSSTVFKSQEQTLLLTHDPF